MLDSLSWTLPNFFAHKGLSDPVRSAGYDYPVRAECRSALTVVAQMFVEIARTEFLKIPPGDEKAPDIEAQVALG
jgi:hypothetical protein